MGTEYYFLYICLSILGLFTLSLIINTCISGSKYFKTFQFLMSSMTYSKEANDLIALTLDKMEAELLVAKLSPTESTIQFYAVDKADDDGETPIYHRTLEADVEIWIESKYYAYGYVQRIGGQTRSEFRLKRPSIKTFYRILKLEERLRKPTETNTAPPKSKKNVVELV